METSNPRNTTTITTKTTVVPQGPRSVLLLVADGSEETEIVVPVDCLRHGGLEVVIASVENHLDITCSGGVRLLADVLLQDILNDRDRFIALVVPGGERGAAKLASMPEVLELVKWFYTQKKLIGAICHGPLVLQAAKVHLGKSLTGHRTIDNRLRQDYHYRPVRSTLTDDYIITSQGPGTSMEFGLQMVRFLVGKDKAKDIANMFHAPSPPILA